MQNTSGDNPAMDQHLEQGKGVKGGKVRVGWRGGRNATSGFMQQKLA